MYVHLINAINYFKYRQRRAVLNSLKGLLERARFEPSTTSMELARLQHFAKTLIDNAKILPDIHYETKIGLLNRQVLGKDLLLYVKPHIDHATYWDIQFPMAIGHTMLAWLDKHGISLSTNREVAYQLADLALTAITDNLYKGKHG